MLQEQRSKALSRGMAAIEQMLAGGLVQQEGEALLALIALAPPEAVVEAEQHAVPRRAFHPVAGAQHLGGAGQGFAHAAHQNRK